MLLRCFTGKTSPANSTVRRRLKSYCARFPNSASRLRTDGVEYQTVSCFEAINDASFPGLLPSSSEIKCRVLPCFAGRYRSKIERSKWKGAWLLKRSCSSGVNTEEHQSTKLSALRWLNVTPFGIPVDPEV